MRAIISYRRGPFTGSLDIGVESENDPAIQDAISRLGDVKIISISFW